MGNKELLVLILKLAQAQKKEQKAQSKVEYRNRELLRYIGGRIGCDFENSYFSTKKVKNSLNSQ
jgi:tetrahydromethanopterin S-methyltransferase subunit G